MASSSAIRRYKAMAGLLEGLLTKVLDRQEQMQ